MASNQTSGPAPATGIRVLMITARADHGGGPKHMELLLRELPTWVVPYIACPDDDPYWNRFASLVGSRMFRIPHRRFEPLCAAKLASYSRRNGIHIVHAHGKGAGVYARTVSALTGLIGVHTAHGVHVGGYGPIGRKFYSLYENATSLWTSHLIHVSREEQLQARSLGLWKSVPASIIANGVHSHDAATIQKLRIEARNHLDLAKELPVVATISRFDYQKNMHEAYAIAKAMPHIHFLWLGTGVDAKALQEQAALDGMSNVRFLGHMEAPLGTLAAADAYLSTSRWEGLPLAVLEAMSLGIPSVLSDVTGHNELVEFHGVGLLYPPGDIGCAIAALNRIIDIQELRQDLAERARAAQCANFSSSGAAARTASLYAALANT